MVKVVEHMPNKHKALNSNQINKYRTTKINKYRKVQRLWVGIMNITKVSFLPKLINTSSFQIFCSQDFLILLKIS
jgi:hypothetical protein